jgi:diguanylate cyclase (GGDEF)-like protein
MFRFLLKAALVLMLIIEMSLVSIAAEDVNKIDSMLIEVEQAIKNAPEKAVRLLKIAKNFENVFSEKQKQKYYFLSANSLALEGKYKEQVTLVLSILAEVKDPEIRAGFLYYLSEGYTNLGEYERALLAMNDGIALLPKLRESESKVRTLQAAIALLNSLNAYSESILYAERMYSLDGVDAVGYSKCIGSANRVEISFLQGDRQTAINMLSEAVRVCDGNGRKIISLILKTLAVVDLINAGHYESGIETGLPLLSDFLLVSANSQYITQLEDAISRAYLVKGNLVRSEFFSLSAYRRARSENVVQMMEKTSETMAKIKRAQGNMASALDYYDINLALKKKVLDDQLHKNLAYQRVKFDIQDKGNQLSLLEQKNKILSTEKQLEQKNNQNLLMLITLGAILMVVLLAWTLKIIRQKNLFRLSSQLDALTQLSNRGHFVACGMQQFEKTQGDISVILFDMDHFKNINDGFGHASGDWVLKAVSARVTALLPKAEMLGRLGGEEFAICLPKFDTHQALALAESCRAAIAAIDSLPCGFAFPITASFGVASRGMRELKEFEDTLAAADKALYFSKTEGRNRVSLYQ